MAVTDGGRRSVEPCFVALFWVRVTEFVRAEEGEGRRRAMVLKMEIMAQ